MGRRSHEFARLSQHQPPCRGGRRHSQTQEAERRFIEDDFSDVQRGVDDDNPHRVRQDVGKDEAIVVSPETGLVGTPQQVQFGLSFKILLNPAIHLQSLIKLKNVQANEASVTPGQQQAPLDDDWIYQVMELTHVGDTRGNDWYTEIQGISRYGKGSLAALLGNSGQNGNGV